MIATIIGATGLIGGHLLELLKNDNTFTCIRLIVRRPVSFEENKFEVKVIDFEDGEALSNAISGSNVVFCAVGTTQKKAGGDKAKYRKVDYDIPVNAARFAAQSTCKCFALVSSVGADSNNSNFYLKLKGEVEDAVQSLSIPSILIFRPSMLLGDRDEFRLGESIGKFFMMPFYFLLPMRFKPIKASNVATAMLAAYKKSYKGYHVFEFKEMKELID